MSILFTPGRLGPLTLKNRIVRSATAERGFHPDGTVAPTLAPFYEALARGGAGLLITGYAYVQASGKCTPLQAGFATRQQAEGWRDVLERTRAADREVKVVIQLVHGGRQAKPEEGQEALAPSAVPDPTTRILPRPMTGEEIEAALDAFASAAARARDVGFDGVQLHGAHGYLISQFTSPHTNRRDDAWGGDAERRRRFLLEALRRCRRAVGEDYPLLVKLNVHDGLPGGIVPEEAREVVRALCGAGIDAVELSGGMFESAPTAIQPDIDIREKEAYFRGHAVVVKEAATCPILLVGGMRTRAVMEEILQSDEADFISLSRPLIREPDLPLRMKDGQDRADCISCNACLRTRRELAHCVALRRSRS